MCRNCKHKQTTCQANGKHYCAQCLIALLCYDLRTAARFDLYYLLVEPKLLDYWQEVCYTVVAWSTPQGTALLDIMVVLSTPMGRSAPLIPKASTRKALVGTFCV